MKFRILEICTSRGSTFRPQIRKLMRWRSFTHSDCYFWYIQEFKTIDEARDYIKKYIDSLNKSIVVKKLHHF